MIESSINLDKLKEFDVADIFAAFFFLYASHRDNTEGEMEDDIKDLITNTTAAIREELLSRSKEDLVDFILDENADFLYEGYETEI